MKPCVLLEQESYCVIAVNDLNSMRGIDAARHAEWQATSGIISILLRIIYLPFGQSPLGVWEIVGFRLTFGIGQRLAFVRPIKRHAGRRIEDIRAAQAFAADYLADEVLVYG